MVDSMVYDSSDVYFRLGNSSTVDAKQLRDIEGFHNLLVERKRGNNIGCEYVNIVKSVKKLMHFQASGIPM